MRDQGSTRNRGGELARRAQHPLERLFGDLAEPTLPNWWGREEMWTPPVNIEETNDAFVVSAELPGMKKEDVDVSVENNVLTLCGERKWERREGGQAHRIESGYGNFSRSFTLPQKVDPDKVQASFDNGMLKVTIPKDESSRSRRIPIA